MRHPFRFRALGVLVAAVQFAAVGGASDLDALVFHPTDRPAPVAVSHVESATGSACHADRCLLGLVLADRGLAAATSAPARAAVPPRRVAAAPAAESPRHFLPGLEQQPRAPPPPLA